jgi:hypothetical protein
LQIAALVSRVSLSSMLLEVELSVAFALFSWSGSLLTMEWSQACMYPHSLPSAYWCGCPPGHLQHLLLVPWYRAPNLYQPEQACVSGIFVFLCTSNFFSYVWWMLFQVELIMICRMFVFLSNIMHICLLVVKFSLIISGFT